LVKTLLQKGRQKGKDFVGGRQESIISAAVVMMALLVLTKIAGFAKLHFFARIFGASRELDVFWAAFTVPDIIFNIIVLGTINAALIPLFAEKMSKKGSMDDLQKLFSDIAQLFLVFFVISGVLVFIFAPQLSHLIAFGGLGGLGYSGDFSPEDVRMIALLMRIMVFSPIFLGVSSVLTAVLQVNKRFVVPALAPLMYNIGIIIGTVILAGAFDMGVTGLAIGVIIGSVLHLLIQIPLSRSLGFTLVFRGLTISKDIIKLLRLALPRVLGLVGEQVSILVNTFISMGLGTGALSAFRFGSSLYLLPVQMFGSTIAQAALPTLSLDFQNGDPSGQIGLGIDSAGKGRGAKNSPQINQFRRTFSKTLQQILFLVLPAVVFIFVLRLPIVRLVLGAGAFDWEDTVTTAWVLAMFSLAIVFQSVAALVIRAFFAMQDTVVPVVVSIFSMVINVVLAFYLTNFFSHYYDWRPLVQSFFDGSREVSGQIAADAMLWLTTRNSSLAAVGGLAVSAGVATAVEVAILLIILNKRVGVLSWRQFWQPTLKKIFTSFLMLLAMYSIYKWWNFKIDTSTVVSIVSLFMVVGGIGTGIYLGVSAVVDVVEMDQISRVLVKMAERARKVFLNGNSGKVRGN
jgi:putative peptidoglycan lipid II flippase